MSEVACEDPWRRLYDGIARVLLDNRLEPTPTNYAMAHRYLTAQDRAFNGSIERAMQQGGLSAASAAAMIAERSVELSASDLQVMVADAQARLTEVSEIVSISREVASDYGEALATNAAELEAGASPVTVVGTLMGLTHSMIDRTRGVEEQLRIACEEIRTLRDSLADAQDAANHDALTGLPNRRARETGRPFAIAICDIDHFKNFNDKFGHQIGDEVIKFVATSLAKDGGERLFAARYGGEEFVVLFEGSNAKQAGIEIDRIRAAIGARDLKINATGQTLGRLTFSAGIAELSRDDDEITSSMLKRADVALYEAKRSGRNKVVVA
jgi:diguanylate cyclase